MGTVTLSWKPVSKPVSKPALPFTRDDLDTMPDDGYRYEIIDGALIVTPAPSWDHQRAQGRLFNLLFNRCPPDLEVLSAPFDVALAEDTVIEPDIVVARTDDYARRGLGTAPVLAVEVLSPSTRLIDLRLKHARLETGGCPSYWVVDPSLPSITVWELDGPRYRQVAAATGEEELTVTAPFELTIVPARLVGPREASQP